VSAGKPGSAGDEDRHGCPPNAPKKLENVPRPARMNEKFNRRSDGIGDPLAML